VLTGRGFQVERVPAGIVAGDVTGDGVHEREMHDVTPSLVDRREHPIPGWPGLIQKRARCEYRRNHQWPTI
jgi:hypothetical protein